MPSIDPTWLQHSTQFFLALNLDSTPLTSLSILAKRSVASGSSFFTCTQRRVRPKVTYCCVAGMLGGFPPLTKQQRSRKQAQPMDTSFDQLSVQEPPWSNKTMPGCFSPTCALYKNISKRSTVLCKHWFPLYWQLQLQAVARMGRLQ